MHNRLLLNIRGLHALLSLLWVLPSILNAQQQFFDFQYNGPDTIPVNASCRNNLLGKLGSPIVSSVSGNTITSSYFDSIPSGFGLLTHFNAGQTANVLWKVEDNTGLNATFTIPIYFADQTKPVFDHTAAGIPAFISVNSSQIPAVPTGFSANDNCTPVSQLVQAFSQSPLPQPCVNGMVKRTWQATDLAGNTGVFTQNIFIYRDSVPPLLVAPPSNEIVSCAAAGNHLNALSTWLHNHGNGIADDAITPAANLKYKMKVNSVSMDSAQVVAAFLASFSNGCGFQLVGNETVDHVRGVIPVDFFAEDDCANTAFLGRGIFAAIDTTPPVISAPNTTTTEACGGNDDPSKLVAWINNHGGATATDACSGIVWTNFTWTTSNGQNGTGTYGTTASYPAIQPNDCQWHTDITFKLRDDCGNTAQTTLRFAIADLSPPVFGAFQPQDTVYCPDIIPANPSVPVTDNCDATIATTFSLQIMSTLCAGTSLRRGTWTATDDCGNTATATKIFVVLDTVPPKFNLFPADTTVTCGNVPPAAIIGTDVTALDFCGTLQGITFQEVSEQNSDTSKCAHTNYRIRRIFTATDQCGNSTVSVQTISVQDSIGPHFFGFLDTVQSCSNITTLPHPTAEGFCGRAATEPVLFAQTITAGACPDAYNLKLTWHSRDICGYLGVFNQNVQVKDITKPTLAGVPASASVNCEVIPPPPPAGTVTASDNCDESVDIAFVQTELRDPNPANCAHWANYVIQRTWTASDNCGNLSTKTQFINVQDNTAPKIVCAADISLPSQLNMCGTNAFIPFPMSVVDECTALNTGVSLSDTAAIKNTSSLPSNSAAVDSIVLDFVAPNVLPSQPVVGLPILTVILKNADAEQAAEHFKIYDENNQYLGQTAATDAQCGNSEVSINVSAQQMNEWLADGSIKIKLLANGTGVEAINAICPGGGSVIGRFTYSYATQQLPIALQYSLDGGPRKDFPSGNGYFLSSGTHEVRLFATDCAANESSCTSNIKIVDVQAPFFANLPPINAYVGTNDCQQPVVLSFPNVSDNCGFTGLFDQKTPFAAVRFQPDPNVGNVPQDIFLEIPNALTNAIGNGVLTIEHKGDNAHFGEFFKVFDENGIQLTTTTNNPSLLECADTNTTNIPVTMAQISAWAADGVIKIKLESNKDAGNFSDFISPCGPLLPNGTDGISQVRAGITYNYADITYQIRDSEGNLVRTGNLGAPSTTVELGEGVYAVKYFSQDINGNIGESGFATSILDTVAPRAICAPTTIFTNASGISTYTLVPEEIDGGSFDNCSANTLQMSVSQAQFSCNNAGQLVPVTLTVKDASGNTSTCTAQVRVETATFQPDISQDVCEETTVQIFANPPVANGNVVYTYNWTGPNGFIANTANITLPNVGTSNEGAYKVTVTGLTGCTAEGIAMLDIQELPETPVLTANKPSLCLGDDLILHSNTYSGINVTYSWYAGTLGSSVLLGTTTLPDFLIGQPNIGNYNYFVRVNADGCTSKQSEMLDLNVFQKPSSSVLNPSQVLCEGDPLVLGTAQQGSNITYSWTGPNAFASSAQYPAVLANVSLLNAGIYSLVVYENACASEPARVTVNVKPKPSTPQLSNNGPVCSGKNIQLVCNLLSASEYVWVSPLFDTTITNSNALTLSNVNTANAGNWQVYAVQQGCRSDLSAPSTVKVEAVPQIAIQSNAPLCNGADLLLQASSSNPDVQYAWTGPANFVSFEQNPTNGSVAGIYQLIASTSIGCADTATVQVQVAQLPQIATLSYNTNWVNNIQGCVSGTEGLQLQSVMVQPGNYTYHWTGPDGFQSAEANPILPNATSALNGTYSLVAGSSLGCQSPVKSIPVELRNRPNTPVLSNNSPICEGELIELMVENGNDYTGNVVKFDWSAPDGNTQTLTGGLQVNNANPANQSGNYMVVANVDGCPSLPSAPVNVVVFPTPIAPAISGNTPICEGSTLLLSTQQLPGVSYIWSGPAGFTAGVHNPTVPLVNDIHVGSYTLTVVKNGCTSLPGEPLWVGVKPMPLVPTAQNDGPVCLGQAGETLQLSVTSNTATPNALYTWYNASNGNPLGAPVLTRDALINNFSSINEGPTGFYVTASLDGCVSQASVPTFVNFDGIPANTAYAGADFTACDGKPLTLSATQPSVGTGAWTTINGNPLLVVINPNAPNSQVSGVAAGNTYQFAWSLSNGACKNYSTDTVTIGVNTFVKANAIDVIDSCFAESVRLSAILPPNAAGTWSQPAGQQFLQIKIESPADPNTLVTNLEPGNNYFFFWTLADVGCGTSTDTVLVRSIGSVAFAGNDVGLCDNDGCVSLQAAPLSPYEMGLWTSEYGDVQISSPSNFQTTACGLKTGDNVFYWTTNNGACGDKSRDTLTIHFEMAPEATPDTVFVPFGRKTGLNLVYNDNLPDQFEVELVSEPRYGLLELTGEGKYTYQPNLGYAGDDQFVYKVCNLNCLDACDFATVLITVAKPTECEVPTVITPNGDGYNDAFFIPCLGGDAIPDNELTIFNEWGNEVFHAEQYRNDWQGEYNGQPLPAGVYYFVVKFNADFGVKSGFLMIQR